MGVFQRVQKNLDMVEEYHKVEDEKKPFHIEMLDSMTQQNIEKSMDMLQREMMIMNMLSGLSRSKLMLHESISLKHAASMDMTHKKEDFREVFNDAHRKMKAADSQTAKSMNSLRTHWKNMEAGLKPMLSEEKLDMLDSDSKNSEMGSTKLMIEILKNQEQQLSCLGKIVSSHKAQMYEKMKAEMKEKGCMGNDEWDVEAAINRIKKK